MRFFRFTKTSEILIIVIFMLIVYTGSFFFGVSIRRDVAQLLLVPSMESAKTLYENADKAVFLTDKLSPLYRNYEKLVLRKRFVGNFSYYQDENGDYIQIREGFSQKEIDDATQALSVLHERAESVDASFLLIMMPSRFSEDSSAFLASVDYSDAYKDALKDANQGLPLIDLRESMGVKNIKSYLKTDHHWTTESTYLCFTETVKAIENMYGILLDPESLYTSRSNYTVARAEGTMYGSTGLNLGFSMVPYEDFDVYLPAYPTSFHYRHIVKGETQIDIEGPFEKALIDLDLLHNDTYMNKYNVFLYGGNNEMRIINHLQDNGLKLLLVSSSYGRSLAPYISQCFAETRYVDPQKGRFTGDLYEYMDEFMPDVVIYLMDDFFFPV